MSTTALVSVAPGRARTTTRATALAAQKPWPWERLSLLAILVLSAALEFWRIQHPAAGSAGNDRLRSPAVFPCSTRVRRRRRTAGRPDAGAGADQRGCRPQQHD
jgi:hypothetical protein